MSYEVKDKKGRVLLCISRKGKLALSRFPDLTEVEIKHWADFYHELSGEDIESTRSFLRFEEEKESFCS